MTTKTEEIYLRLEKGEKMDVYHNMMTYGGSFVKALAECVMRADSQNLKKLINTFEDYFERYLPENWS